MIDTLCERILGNEKFINDFEKFINSGLELGFTKSLSDNFTINSDEFSKLLQSASIFSISNSIDNKQIAYEIAITAWKHLQHKTIKDIGVDPTANVIAFILARLGNFPAEMKFEKDYGKRLDLPRPLWFEEEFHRMQNTINIGSDKKITC